MTKDGFVEMTKQEYDELQLIISDERRVRKSDDEYNELENKYFESLLEITKLKKDLESDYVDYTLEKSAHDRVAVSLEVARKDVKALEEKIYGKDQVITELRSIISEIILEKI